MDAAANVPKACNAPHRPSTAFSSPTAASAHSQSTTSGKTEHPHYSSSGILAPRRLSSRAGLVAVEVRPGGKASACRRGDLCCVAGGETVRVVISSHRARGLSGGKEDPGGARGCEELHLKTPKRVGRQRFTPLRLGSPFLPPPLFGMAWRSVADRCQGNGAEQTGFQQRRVLREGIPSCPSHALLCW